MSLKTTRALVTPNAGLSAAFFNSAAPAKRLAVYSAAGPEIRVFLAMLLLTGKYAAKNQCL